jgi:hypothetical protein
MPEKKDCAHWYYFGKGIGACAISNGHHCVYVPAMKLPSNLPEPLLNGCGYESRVEERKAKDDR